MLTLAQIANSFQIDGPNASQDCSVGDVVSYDLTWGAFCTELVTEKASGPSGCDPLKLADSSVLRDAGCEATCKSPPPEGCACLKELYFEGSEVSAFFTNDGFVQFHDLFDGEIGNIPFGLMLFDASTDTTTLAVFGEESLTGYYYGTDPENIYITIIAQSSPDATTFREENEGCQDVASFSVAFSGDGCDTVTFSIGPDGGCVATAIPLDGVTAVNNCDNDFSLDYSTESSYSGSGGSPVDSSAGSYGNSNYSPLGSSFYSPDRSPDSDSASDSDSDSDSSSTFSSSTSSSAPSSQATVLTLAIALLLPSVAAM